MLEKLRHWLRPDTGEEQPPDKALSAAVLLLEIAHADGVLDERELVAIRALVGAEFGLDGDRLAAVMAAADERLHQSVDVYEYARALCHGLPVADRLRLLTGMWRIALVDDALDRHEESSLRKLARLLGLRHSEFIRAKHMASGEHG